MLKTKHDGQVCEGFRDGFRSEKNKSDHEHQHHIDMTEGPPDFFQDPIESTPFKDHKQTVYGAPDHVIPVGAMP